MTADGCAHPRFVALSGHDRAAVGTAAGRSAHLTSAGRSYHLAVARRTCHLTAGRAPHWMTTRRCRSAHLIIANWSVVELCVRARLHRGHPPRLGNWCSIVAAHHALGSAWPGPRWCKVSGRGVLAAGKRIGAVSAVLLRHVGRSGSHHRSHVLVSAGYRWRVTSTPVMSRHGRDDNDSRRGRFRSNVLMFCDPKRKRRKKLASAFPNSKPGDPRSEGRETIDANVGQGD